MLMTLITVSGCSAIIKDEYDNRPSFIQDDFGIFNEADNGYVERLNDKIDSKEPMLYIVSSPEERLIHNSRSYTLIWYNGRNINISNSNGVDKMTNFINKYDQKPMSPSEFREGFNVMVSDYERAIKTKNILTSPSWTLPILIALFLIPASFYIAQGDKKAKKDKNVPTIEEINEREKDFKKRIEN